MSLGERGVHVRSVVQRGGEWVLRGEPIVLTAPLPNANAVFRAIFEHQEGWSPADELLRIMVRLDRELREYVTGNMPADVSISAYKGSDGTVVVVAINGGVSNAVVPLTIAGGTAPATMTPHVTSADDDLEAGTALPVNGGVLMASLPGKTVTTFVGK